MKNLKGKTVFITGGAEGIGFNAARILAGQGMNVMLADIDSVMLNEAVSRLQGDGLRVEGVVCDVAVKDDWIAAAKKTIDVFGKVHVLINNAGVALAGSQKNITESDWRWIIDVNLMGVVFGTQVFAPLLKSHGEGGHIMNVASLAGLHGVPFSGPYCATKAAVISLSECWRSELAKDGIIVSVLCPGYVKSRIYDSMRNRQERYGGPVYFEDLVSKAPFLAANREMVASGIDTEIAGQRILEAILQDEYYVFTHPFFRELQHLRDKNINTGFDNADSSPALKDVPRTGVLPVL